MPVSHLGLTVSHIPSATSFYLAALQPLGYTYIGQQGDSIGLGIKDADFFLCQERNGSRPSPTHIAFAADNRLTVRDCYAAALNAGGRPSGAPNYRNNDCSCFNAAVVDLDGNTIEFIFREPCEAAVERGLPAPSEHSNVQSWQNGVARSVANEDNQSINTKASQPKSRMQTAMDVASTASKSMKSTPPNPGITRSRTEPLTSSKDSGGKALVGTLIGAAAGAAFGYAMISSERQGARDEAAFASSMRSKAPSAKDSKSKHGYEKSTLSKTPSRTYSRTDSARSSRHPPRSMRMIEPAPYEDYDVQDIISRYNSSQRPSSQRPQPQRSRTYDAIEWHASSNGRSDRPSAKRASTLPLDMPDYLDGARSVPASRYTSRRGSLEDKELKRHDSAVSVNSHRSRHSSTSKAAPSKHSRRNSVHESAANVPLPQSRATSYAPSYISAAQMPLPQSQTAAGYTDTGEESDGLGDMKTVVPDDSISCVDFSSKTGKKSKSSRHGSKRSEADSERTVRPSKPSGSKHFVQTLPVRSKDDYYSNRGGKRSMATYV